MNDVTKITLVLENCERIELSPQDIGVFIIEKITERIARIAINSITKLKSAETVAIEIFSAKTHSRYNTFGGHSASTISERITNHADIVAIEICFANGTEETYYVAWGDSDFTNDFQKVQRGENGNLYIVIDEVQNIDDVFDRDFMREDISHLLS